MTALYLRTAATQSWQRIYFDASASGFKFTRENPYFSQSEDYSLEVTIPLGIPDNLRFFGPLHLKSVAKRKVSLQCRLTIDEREVMTGTATLTEISEQALKMQLLGGSSEFTFLASENRVYIDEISIMSAQISGGFTVPSVESSQQAFGAPAFVFMPAIDETNGICMNRHNYRPDIDRPVLDLTNYEVAAQPSLLLVISQVITSQGFTIRHNALSFGPWRYLYVASARRVTDIAHALPHWTVREFLTEVSRFFNVTFLFQQATRQVDIIHNALYYSRQGSTFLLSLMTPAEQQAWRQYQQLGDLAYGTSLYAEADAIAAVSAQEVTIDVADEYTVETDDDEQTSLSTSTLAFSLSGSAAHQLTVIDQSVLDAARHVACTDYDDAASRMEDEYLADAVTAANTIYEWPDGMLIHWQEEGTYLGRRCIHQFRPLKRTATDGTTEAETLELKIVPCAVEGTYDAATLLKDGAIYRAPTAALTLENPAGNESWQPEDLPSPPSVQDMITGEATVEKKEKEDRLQLFFCPPAEHQVIVHESDGNGSVVGNAWFRDIFADLSVTYWGIGDTARNSSTHAAIANRYSDHGWSLAFVNNRNTAIHLGLLHAHELRIDTRVLHKFRFVADTIPSPRSIFVISGHRYLCKKIEATVLSDGIDRLMRGEFYRLL